MSVKLSLILSVDLNNIIGYADGNLPYVKSDRMLFKNITTYTPDFSSNLLIVGRKTFDTLPDIVKNCPRRKFAVLTSNPSGFSNPNAKFFSTFNDILSYCVQNKFYKYFVIGGATVYDLAIQTNLVTEIFITKIFIDLIFHLGTSQTYVTVGKLSDAKYELCASNIIKSDLKLNESICVSDIQIEFQHWTIRFVPFELQYVDLVKRIILNGYPKLSRNGQIRSLPDQRIKIDLSQGFPILTIRKAFFRGIVEELLWMMRGQTDVKILREKNIHIWDGNSDLSYLKRVGLDQSLSEYDIGPGYGFQMRHCAEPYVTAESNYVGKGTDQLKQCVDLIRTDPSSRRIIMNLWSVPQLKQMALAPCHLLYQFTVNQNQLSCHLYQRSWDVNLGWNTSTGALLTHLMAHFTDLEVGTLTHTICDAHLYDVHLEKIKTFIDLIPHKLPQLAIVGPKPTDIGLYDILNIKLHNYKSHPVVSGMQMVS